MAKKRRIPLIKTERLKHQAINDKIQEIIKEDKDTITVYEDSQHNIHPQLKDCCSAKIFNFSNDLLKEINYENNLEDVYSTMISHMIFDHLEALALWTFMFSEYKKLELKCRVDNNKYSDLEKKVIAALTEHCEEITNRIKPVVLESCVCNNKKCDHFNFIIPIFNKGTLIGAFFAIVKKGSVIPGCGNGYIYLGAQIGSTLEKIKQGQNLKLIESIHDKLIQHTINAQEEERKRIARELHDVVIQEMATLSLISKTVELLLDKDGVKAKLLLSDLRKKTTLELQY